MNRLAIALLLALCGCGYGQPDPPAKPSTPAQPLSGRYGVCMHLPAGYSFSNYEEAIDFDVAKLTFGRSEADVYIGYHPDFSQSAKRTVAGAGHFKFLGEEAVKGQDRILFGHDRKDRPGPIFVMFAAVDLEAMRRVLRTEGFVVDCRAAG